MVPAFFRRRPILRCLCGIPKGSPEDVLVQITVWNHLKLPGRYCPLVSERLVRQFRREPERQTKKALGTANIVEVFQERREASYLYCDGEPSLAVH